ncbi:fumarylacetoacetate hydrolase family protein [Salibacterium aidingense]|uniref:fumarylacetoacetate hydrolase family protein n=1 Tax=Salibacterium aidingense TaxID=384933 RepID=UPI000405A516|nr:fumarylacetoacetate hydrolase family protein [Salibacterium aidingense]
MKFARFAASSEVLQGVAAGNVLKEIEGNIFDHWNYTGRSFSQEEVKLLAPLEPNQIIGIGANFVTKTEELPEALPDIPVFFFKPTSSVIGPDDDIVMPAAINEVKFESELAVVIGKDTKNVTTSEALDYVFGYTVGNDVTAPQYFREDNHWMVGKSFDTFTPLGPYLETELNPLEARVKASLNNIEKQNSSTALMIVPIQEMIAYLSRVMTLKKGDVLLTGSPAGAEMVTAGSTITCAVEGIGDLTNSFVKAKEATGPVSFK